MFVSWLAILLAGCSAIVTDTPATLPDAAPEYTVLLTVDGETRSLLTRGRTVAEALELLGIALNPADVVEPPPATTLSSLAGASPIGITVARITETLEVIPESIPFGRQIVRNTEMSPDEAPRIMQTGKSGLQEVTVRIVYRDGLETERWPTSVTIVDEPRDEIVMIGVVSGAANAEALRFSGQLAYIDSGRAVVLKGSTDAPQQLTIEGKLDGRVFQLSPDGRFLLYTTTVETATTSVSFRNLLWVIGVDGNTPPRSLQIENVLWAGWDPASTPPRVAYTTARSTSLPPGWEANNDLWLLEIAEDGQQPAPLRLIENYATAYGWWGGQYAWSPIGGTIAYAFAGEVGLLDLTVGTAADETGDNLPLLPEPARSVVHSFTELDNGADWAWLPSLSWSADGRWLAFTALAGDGARSGEQFDLWLADVTTGEEKLLVEGAGSWSQTQWSPPALLPSRQLASLRAIEPAASQDSGYTLWLSAEDGSDAQRVFPPEGESGRFDRSAQSLVWGPEEDMIAFIFDDTLHILVLSTGEFFRAGQDDTVSSHPTWAPYGAAAGN